MKTAAHPSKRLPACRYPNRTLHQ